MPDSFLVVALGLDPRAQGKRRSGRPGRSARGPSMTGKEAVRGDEESQPHLPGALEVAGGAGGGVAVGEQPDQPDGVERTEQRYVGIERGRARGVRWLRCHCEKKK